MMLLDARIKSLKDLVGIQGDDGNWNSDNYMLGLFNGMELALATIEGREPGFRWRPDEGFLHERMTPFAPGEGEPVQSE